MPTLENIQGASLVPDFSQGLNALLQTFGTKQSRAKEQAASNQQAELQRLSGIVAGATSATPEQQESALLRLSSLNPAIANSMRSSLERGDKLELADIAQKTEEGTALALQIQGQPTFADKQQALTAAAQTAASKGDDVSRFVELSNLSEPQLDLELQRMLIQGADIKTLAGNALAPPKEDPFTLSQGQVRFGPGGEQIAAVTKPEAPKDVQKQVNVIRKSINENLKAFRKVESSFKRIAAVTKNPSAAGDLALIFNFMKMLDPGSVVRESEFRTAEQAKAWLVEAGNSGITVPAFVVSAIQKAKTGEKMLVPQRADFVNQANNLFGAARTTADNEIDNFLQQADQDQISRKRVLGGKRLEDFEKRQEERQEEQAVPVFSGALNREVSEQDISDTLSANPGLTREQLLEQLQVQ